MEGKGSEAKAGGNTAAVLTNFYIEQKEEDLAEFVENLLKDMQKKFDDMSGTVITKYECLSKLHKIGLKKWARRLMNLRVPLINY